MTYNEFSNDEVLYLYLLNRKRLEYYQDIIQNKVLIEELQVLVHMLFSAQYTIDDQQVDKILDSAYYKYLVNTDEKLEPIVQMIEEADPDLYEAVLNSLKLSI